MDKRVARFDGWVIDFDSGEISRDGETHRLQDQPLQILEELVARPGEVVTREHLIARLWPTGVVEFDTGLNSAIRKLRLALKDDAETPRYIETLPRKGYRFVGQLDPEPRPPGMPLVPAEFIPTAFETGPAIGRRASDRHAPARRLAVGFASLLAAVVLGIVAWRMPGGFFESAVPEEKLPTIVVLPLTDMSVDQNEQALCDGLTEELSNWLANIPSLRVVARTSAFSFKGKNLDVRDIARALDASHVLEGSLRRSGTQLRITMQLIKGADGLHMWSKSFDLPMGDIFLIEDTVSRSVAEALHLELSAETAERWAQRKPGTAEAVELYMLGRDRQRRRTAEDNLRAIEFFRRALEADPNYALALTGLSESLLNGLSLNRMPLEDVTTEVEPLLNRAISASPKLAEAYATLGWLRTEQYRFDEALPLLQKATAMNPNDAASHRFLGVLYDRSAQPNRALEHYSDAAKLDPRDFISHVFRCQVLVDFGQFEEATAACARARELDAANLWGPLATAWVSRARGATGQALDWIDAARKLAPTDSTLVDQRIELLLTLGRIPEARAMLGALPLDATFFTLAREGGIVFAEGGAPALEDWLARTQLAGKAATGAELAELARLQLMAADPAAARATLAHAQRVLPMTSADLFDASQIRHAYSAAIIHAGIELYGGGDRAKAMALLEKLDEMLATYEKNGGEHYGLYSIRAESLAMQDQPDAAAAALRKAWDHGWRATWRARREPYLQGIRLPEK